MRDKKYIETRDAQRKINEELSKLAENNLSYIDIVTTNLDTLKTIYSKNMKLYKIKSQQNWRDWFLKLKLDLKI